MRQFADLALVALLSCVGTLLVVTRVWPSARFPDYYSRAETEYSPRYYRHVADPVIAEQPMPYRQQSAQVHSQPQPQPYRQARYAPVQPLYSANANNGTTGGVMMRQEGKNCASDPYSCGEGYFCCHGTCKTAQTMLIEFAADDKGELYICGWKARYTTTATQKANYYGPIPCGEYLYLKAINTIAGTESGGSIGIEYPDGGKKGSGNNLFEQSQTGGTGGWATPVWFEYWMDKFPYTDLKSRYGAYPVLDPYQPKADVTNFRFKGC